MHLMLLALDVCVPILFFCWECGDEGCTRGQMIVGCVCDEFQEEVVRSFVGAEERCRPFRGVPRQRVSVVACVENICPNEMGNGGLRAASTDGARSLPAEQLRGDSVDCCLAVRCSLFQGV